MPHFETDFNVGTEPSSIVMDSQGKKCYIADMTLRSLFMKEMEDKSNSINEVAKDFEGEPFLGPHALALSEDSSKRNPLILRQSVLH